MGATLPFPLGASRVSSTVADASAAAARPALDAEKLVVYAVALELQALCATLVPPTQRVLHDQMERASLSVVLTVAEGAGRRSRKDKRRFYAMARGSSIAARWHRSAGRGRSILGGWQ